MANLSRTPPPMKLNTFFTTFRSSPWRRSTSMAWESPHPDPIEIALMPYSDSMSSMHTRLFLVSWLVRFLV